MEPCFLNDGFPSPVDSGGLGGRKILVVEDSWTQRAHVVALLRSLGAGEVFQASDGIEGLGRLVEDAGIDLLFCDLEMPNMDGVALIGEMAARGLAPDLIILSSQDAGILESVRLMSVSYGMARSAVLLKPLAREDIVRVLSQPPFAMEVRAPFAASRPGPLPLQEIRRGLGSGEFECYFQPQLTLQGAHLRGVEALVRWRHPELGVLAPAEFLPQVEADPGLMSSLTIHILEDIAPRWHRWRQAGLALEVAVNLSAASLCTAGFADRLMECVAGLGLAAKDLVLEVTESASVSNLSHLLGNLARLRMRGFNLSIDDFGTGYATYEQLERIPFTELKIDMSITRDLPRSHKKWVLAKSLLRLARDLRLRTVAEGIETPEAWSSLKNLGCDRGQGYFLARPMPGAQVEGWSAQDRSHL